MPIRIYKKTGEFRGALQEHGNVSYVLLGASKIKSSVLGTVLSDIRQQGSHALEQDEAVVAEAYSQIIAFFERSGQLDPGWCFSFSSKIPLSIPGYQDIQKIFLILAHRHVHPNRDLNVLVIGSELNTLLCQVLADTLPRQRRLPGFRGMLRLGRSLARVLLNNTLPAKKVDSLIFTLSARPPENGVDTYFGSLASEISKKESVATVYFCAGTSIRLPAGESIYPIEAFASYADLFSGLIASMRAVGESMNNAAQFSVAGHGAIYSFLRNQEVTRGEPVYTTFLAAAFKGMLRKISPQRVLYPFENRGWEKHLLAAIRDAGIQRSIGYQHSSITPRHLAFHISPGQPAAEWVPDQVVTIGEITASCLRSSAPVLADRLTVGASLRRIADSSLPAPDSDAVLIAISSSREEAWSLINMAYEMSGLVDIPCYIRTHPTIPVDDIYRSFDWPEHVQLSSGKALIEDIQRSSMVVYSSSTVALEGMLFGRIPLFADIGDIPSGDPIPGEYPFKYCAESADSLAAAINSIRVLAEDERAHLQHAAAELAGQYMYLPDQGRMEQLLMDMEIV